MVSLALTWTSDVLAGHSPVSLAPRENRRWHLLRMPNASSRDVTLMFMIRHGVIALAMCGKGLDPRMQDARLVMLNG